MKILLDQLHVFKIDSLSDDEDALNNASTPKIIRCIRMIPTNELFKDGFQPIDQSDSTKTPNLQNLNYETPISSKLRNLNNLKAPSSLVTDEKIKIVGNTKNSSMEFISAHSESNINTSMQASLVNECNNNEEV